MSATKGDEKGPPMGWIGVVFALALVAMSAWVVLEWASSMPPE